MSYFVYCHIRNDTGKIFYIGKGNARRPWDVYNRNKYWNHIYQKHGIKVDILAKWKQEKEAFEHEKFLIKTFREMGFQLANLTDGCQGVSGMPKSAETKRKLSEAKIGKPNFLIRGEKNPAKTPESRAKRSLAMKKFYENGGTNPMQNKVRHDLAIKNKEVRYKGLKNKKSRPIIVNGTFYESINIASKETGILGATLRWRAINAPEKYGVVFCEKVN